MSKIVFIPFKKDNQILGSMQIYKKKKNREYYKMTESEYGPFCSDVSHLCYAVILLKKNGSY